MKKRTLWLPVLAISVLIPIAYQDIHASKNDQANSLLSENIASLTQPIEQNRWKCTHQANCFRNGIDDNGNIIKVPTIEVTSFCIQSSIGKTDKHLHGCRICAMIP